jgi:polysaccharide export outer membrane protein
MRSASREQGWHAHPVTGRVHALVTMVMCWGVVVMGVAGCTSSLPPLPPPAASPSVPEPIKPAGPGTSAAYTLGPGDGLRITIYGQGDLPQEVVLSSDGSFTYPFIGHVQAAGLTVSQLADTIAHRLAEGYLVNPQLTIAVTQYSSQQVYVLGAVKSPGVQTLKRHTTLLELLSVAGGPTPEAGTEVIIARTQPQEGARSIGHRQSTTEAVRVNLEKLLAGEVFQRLEIEPGDTIYLPKGAFFFVAGEVQKPGRYPLERDTTVAKALILAGGPNKFAALKRATVQRVVDGQRLEYHADLNAVLQADDILVIPQSIF